VKIKKTKLKQIIIEELENLSEAWQDDISHPKKVPNPVKLTPFSKTHRGALGQNPSKNAPRGVSDLLVSANNIRNHLDMIASDVENLNKVMGKANAIHKAIEHQNLEEAGAAASEYIDDVKGLSQSLQQSVSEIELLVASLGDTQ